MPVEPIDRSASERDADNPLAQALCSLPAQRPPTDGWQRLSAELEASAFSPLAESSIRRPRRRYRWLAVAAALAIAAIALPLRTPDVATPAGVPVATNGVPTDAQPVSASRSDQLINESARLESLLAWMAPGARSAEAIALDVSLIDRLQWIDHLLADRHASDATREVLWNERVDLMTQRVALSQRESLVALSNVSNQRTTH